MDSNSGGQFFWQIGNHKVSFAEILRRISSLGKAPSETAAESPGWFARTLSLQAGRRRRLKKQTDRGNYAIEVCEIRTQLSAVFGLAAEDCGQSEENQSECDVPLADLYLPSIDGSEDPIREISADLVQNFPVTDPEDLTGDSRSHSESESKAWSPGLSSVEGRISVSDGSLTDTVPAVLLPEISSEDPSLSESSGDILIGEILDDVYIEIVAGDLLQSSFLDSSSRQSQLQFPDQSSRTAEASRIPDQFRLSVDESDTKSEFGGAGHTDELKSVQSDAIMDSSSAGPDLQTHGAPRPGQGIFASIAEHAHADQQNGEQRIVLPTLFRGDYRRTSGRMADSGRDLQAVGSGGFRSLLLWNAVTSEDWSAGRAEDIANKTTDTAWRAVYRASARHVEVIPSVTESGVQRPLKQNEFSAKVLRTGIRECIVEKEFPEEHLPGESPRTSPQGCSTASLLKYAVQARAPPSSERISLAQADAEGPADRLRRLRFSIAPRGPSLASTLRVKSDLNTFRSLS